MNAPLSRTGFFADLDEREQRAFVSRLTQKERNAFDADFANSAHPGQLPPEGDWFVWLVMAGRGFGKTRAGAEWVRAVAEAVPGARIALIGANLGEARAVMVEGESGIMACSPPEARPLYEPSLRRLTWPNGAVTTLYSAAEPESLRGPQHSHARRTGAEGVYRQRSVCAYRHAASPRCRRRRSRSAGCPSGRRLLPRIGWRQRSICRA